MDNFSVHKTILIKQSFTVALFICHALLLQRDARSQKVRRTFFLLKFEKHCFKFPHEIRFLAARD